MTRILFLAFHFPPVGGGGVQRNAKFARYLPEHGYEPVVVTCPGPSPDRWTPRDDTLASDISPSIDVHRVPGSIPPACTGFDRRVERLLGRRPAWESWWVEAAVRTGLEMAGNCDLIYASLVPYETADAAAQLATQLGIPWVADLQDPWALDEMWLYPTGWHRRRDLRRMEALLASAGAIIMNTPEATARVARSLPHLAGRLAASIPNGFDEADFVRPVPARSDGVFRIVHSGYLHTELGLRQRKTAPVRRLLGGEPVPGVDILTRSHLFLLEALERLASGSPELAGALEVHLAGALTAADKRAIDGNPLVRLHGYLPHGETIDLVRTADLLFLPMHDLPAGTRAGIVPGKTYEYLASGRPILAAVPDGDARDLLVEAGTARLCRPSDVPGMTRAIASEIERWRSGARTPAPDPGTLAEFERRRLTARLAHVFDDVLDSPAAARASLVATSA